jgi:TM2 domain-containing membrane protein YozV
MSIINLIWKTIILLVCSIIQTIGVFVEGIAKVLMRITRLLVNAHDRILDCSIPKKKKKEVHIHVPL